MASGNRRIIINLKERLNSDDINRLQAASARHTAELYRYFLDSQTMEAQSWGNTTIGATTDSPMRGVILSGMMPTTSGTAPTTMSITAGVALVVNPDAPASSDDSPYKCVIAPSGTVAMPTIGTNDRIGILEATRVNVLTESATRDVFNTSSGTFAPQTVEKVREDHFTYAIRLGSDTTTAGWPGFQSGKLPLAIIIFASNATSFDNAEIYDVRPLVNTRINAPFDDALAFAHDGLNYITVTSANANMALNGSIRAVFGNHLAGGTVNNLNIETVDTVNLHEPGFAYTASQVWYMWACFPFGLPRWCKYTTGTSRTPGTFMGIPVISNTQPDSWSADFPSDSNIITLPTKFAGISDTDQCCVLYAGPTSSGTPSPIRRIVSDGNASFFLAGTGQTNPAVTPTTGGVASSSQASWVINASDNRFPLNARAIYVTFSTILASDASAPQSFNMSRQVSVTNRGNSNFGYTYTGGTTRVYFSANSQTMTESFTVRIPLDGIPGGSPPNRDIQWTTGISSSTTAGTIGQSSTTMTIIGWELGP